jgi:putative glutamine amidotransferase
VTRATPAIVITVADPGRSSEPAVAARKNGLYAEAVTRAGGTPILIDDAADPERRSAAFASMDGLLLSGGADIDPARYGRETDGARDVERGRDALEAEAWAEASARGLPVLGICRGLQAVNVFAGGTLTQHVDGHARAAFGHGTPGRHELRLVHGTRIAALLSAAGLRASEPVNSFHHQAVGPSDLAPGLVAAGWSPSPVGDIVEALESADGRWVAAVQCHPERLDSTPTAFEALFAAFVGEARERVGRQRGGPATR